MQLITLISLLPAVALAQYGYGDSSGATATNAVAKATQTSSVKGVHIVKVAQNGSFVFEPNSMTVPVGDTVEFHFWPKSHSIAQSSFDKPCQPLDDTSFFSGPVAVSSGMSPTTYSIKVTSAGPIWYYCATGQHCQAGMGGVINPPAANATRTIENYIKAAALPGVNNIAPQSVQGGTLGPAATADGASASGTTSSPSSTSTPGAASRGAVSWGLLGVAGLIGAAFV